MVHALIILLSFASQKSMNCPFKSMYLVHDSLDARVSYAACSCMLYAFYPGIYAIIAPAISNAFGPKYFQVAFLNIIMKVMV